MTGRNIGKEIGHDYYRDMEDGRNNSETICYPSLIRILEELVDRITVQELRVDALNEQMSLRSVNEREWIDNADKGFIDWFHSFYGPHSSRSDYFQEILKIEDPKERQDALMFWSKATFYAGYERSLCDKLEEKIKHEEND